MCAEKQVRERQFRDVMLVNVLPKQMTINQPIQVIIIKRGSFQILDKWHDFTFGSQKTVLPTDCQKNVFPTIDEITCI